MIKFCRYFFGFLLIILTNLSTAQHTSIEQHLSGRVSGLRVNSFSGTPGSMSQIRIRGEGSFSLTNEPLIVIDGMPFLNSEIPLLNTPHALDLVKDLIL